jgi:sulfur-oxidizing protein SoxZ
MRIRAKLVGDVADVRVLMAHPMDVERKTGGKVVPAHFIRQIRAELNGKVVWEAHISQAVSKNPVFAFKVKGAKAGDKLSVTWEDNKGDTRTDSITLGAS